MSWLTDLMNAIKALPRMERQMGALATTLAGISDQLGKAKLEIVGKIDALQAQLATAGELDEADVAALQAVRDAAQALDDIVPDVPTPAPGETGLESRLPGEPTA